MGSLLFVISVDESAAISDLVSGAIDFGVLVAEGATGSDRTSTLPIYGDVNQPAAITAAEAIANIQDVLGGNNNEECIHGEMAWKEGEKNGRGWGGFFCTYAPRTGEAKCSTVWYSLGSSGKWERQKLRSV